MTVDTDLMVEILKKDKPLNVTAVEGPEGDKLIVLFALPHLTNQIVEFAQKLLDEHEKDNKIH